AKFNDYNCYDVLVFDDGSTDGSLDSIPDHPALKTIVNPKISGAGFGVRFILEYAQKHGYKAVFFVSGNDKDEPKDIPKLKKAIEEGYDLVQGSRYLPDGRQGKMPFYRIIATRFIHPWLFSLITGLRITDSTNGFRAVSMSMFEKNMIDLKQDWLDHYELEPYLFYKAIKLGFKVKEVPVTKIYPPKSEGYTKMKPFSGWWSILRPLVFLGLGIRK
ncbi:MAG TPA: glycosyltransferase family 2 protein, partial [Candidatus Omnitrophota bacterium]|nr:glycosyltransferase family 2 protein [Candidatus Omnitrophota bacterium]